MDSVIHIKNELLNYINIDFFPSTIFKQKWSFLWYQTALPTADQDSKRKVSEFIRLPRQLPMWVLHRL